MKELKKFIKCLFYVVGDDESLKSVFLFEWNFFKDNLFNEIVVKYGNKWFILLFYCIRSWMFGVWSVKILIKKLFYLVW